MFTVPMRPVGKGRPRFGKGHVFTPQKTRDAEELIAWHAKRFQNEAQDGPVSIEITARFKAPAKLFQAPHTKKPDASNILKLCEDSLNGILYADDSLIFDAHITKVYWTEDSIEITVTYA